MVINEKWTKLWKETNVTSATKNFTKWLWRFIFPNTTRRKTINTNVKFVKRFLKPTRDSKSILAMYMLKKRMEKLSAIFVQKVFQPKSNWTVISKQYETLFEILWLFSMLFAEEDNNFNSRLKPNWAGSVCVLVYCFYILNFSSIPQWQARAIFYRAYILVTIRDKYCCCYLPVLSPIMVLYWKIIS